MQLPIKLELLISIVLLATLSCARQAPPESVDLLIINARVIVGTGDVHNRATIAIRGERILAIADTERRFNARVTIDAEDKTVLPGLINMHIHIGTGGRFADEEELAAYVRNELPAAFQDYLSHGVTSIKSVGDIPGPFIEVRERLAQGEIQGPRLFLAGTPLTAVDGHPAITAYRDNPWHRASWTRELDSEACTSSARMGHFGLQVKRQSKPMLIGLV